MLEYFKSLKTNEVLIKYLLDGDFEFNKARLINHSCNPNCEALDESKSKIWITAIRNIKKK